MQLNVTGRHLQISDEMKRYAEEKAGKLPRYYDRLESAEVILDHISNTFTVEIVARADHRSVFVAHSEGGEFHEAYDIAIDKLERQLTRHKERFRNRKHAAATDEVQSPETGA